MKYLREIIRLQELGGLSQRKIANACNVSPTTAGNYISKAIELNLSYEKVCQMTDDELNSLFTEEPKQPDQSKVMPDMKYLHKELSRKHVTLQLLWEEYRQEHPDGYGRSQFAHHYRQWKETLNPVMRINHKRGEKVFVDFSGSRPEIVDPMTGEVTQVELFVGVLGASDYTFATCVNRQTIPDWLECHVRMFKYFDGVPECVVPDNLKSGVTKPCFYDPEINPAYAELASHYDVIVMPARKSSPKDKAKAENGVLHAQRRILAVLRNRVFHHITELNDAIYEELEKLNTKPMQIMKVSRKELFEELDKPVMRSLPLEPFEQFEWKQAKVHIDYHIEIEKTYYSVPYTLIHKRVDVRYNSRKVEIMFNNKCVATHIRASRRGFYVTAENHMPKNHSYFLEWTPDRIRKWANEQVGDITRQFIDELMESRPHPEQAFKSCIGVIRLGKKYTPERLEQACKRALSLEAISYRSVKSILDKGLDKVHYLEPSNQSPVTSHENVRGNDYYKQENKNADYGNDEPTEIGRITERL